LKTPLHYAAQACHIPLAALLLERGADVNAKDDVRAYFDIENHILFTI
jgi:ankyrin repeat protein